MPAVSTHFIERKGHNLTKLFVPINCIFALLDQIFKSAFWIKIVSVKSIISISIIKPVD